MIRALTGAVAGAIAMFVIGFLFFATPLQRLGVSAIDDNQAAAVQQALASNLPDTGTYVVPDAGTRAQSLMYSRGPVAIVHYNMGGFAAADPGVLLGGFIHMLIVSLLLAGLLYEVSRTVAGLADRVKILAVAVLAATVYMRLGDPIWYHQDWAYAIYTFVADSITLMAAGLIILKLLPRRMAEATPPTSDV